MSYEFFVLSVIFQGEILYREFPIPYMLSSKRVFHLNMFWFTLIWIYDIYIVEVLIQKGLDNMTWLNYYNYSYSIMYYEIVSY